MRPFHSIFGGGQTSVLSIRSEADRTSDGVKKCHNRLHINLALSLMHIEFVNVALD